MTATVTRIAEFLSDSPARLWREVLDSGLNVVADLAAREQIDSEQANALVDSILFGTPTLCRREAWADYLSAYENLRSLNDGIDPRTIDPDVADCVPVDEARECLTRQFEREMADAIELALRGRP